MKLVIKSSLIISFLLIIQSGCSPLIVSSMLATATVITKQDKSLGNIIDDTTMMIKINKELFKYGLFSSIKVKVSEGRVLLIGNVDTFEKQIKAEKIAWQQKEVKEVINEIKVNPIQTNSIIDNTLDSIITTEIKTRLLGKKNIKSVNYSINTINKVVYLIGIAQNKEELKTVMAIARKVKGVKQVISYVRYKNSKLRN